MHEDVAAENERMRIDLSDNTAAAGSDMSENTVSLGIITQGLEVEVVDRRALGLVQCWARAGYVLNIG